MSDDNTSPLKSTRSIGTILLACSGWICVAYLIFSSIFSRSEPPNSGPVMTTMQHQGSFSPEKYREIVRDQERRDHERRMRHSMDSIDWSLQRMANDRQYGRVIIQD